jgi:beta-N-acetylhexosaminidase
MSDDLSMQALDGPLSVRAKAALFAGCDLVLHCNGKMDEMKQVASEAKELAGSSARRSAHALAHLAAPEAPFDAERAQARLAELLASPAAENAA